MSTAGDYFIYHHHEATGLIIMLETHPAIARRIADAHLLDVPAHSREGMAYAEIRDLAQASLLNKPMTEGENPHA